MCGRVPNYLIKEVFSESLSEGHISIIRKLTQPMYDEDIAAELGIKATTVRTMLNDLHERNLVEYERIKNKATGWYTYIWKKREDKLREYIKTFLEEKINRLNEELEIERAGVFKCSCRVVSLEEAIENNFICPNCKETFVNFNNSSKIRELKKEIERTKELYNKV